MTRSQKRTFNQLLIFLIILVLMLTIALLVRRRLAPADSAADSSTSQTEQIQSSAVSTLSWNNGDTLQSFSLGEDGAWRWDGDRDFPLDPAALSGMLSQLSPITPVKTITTGDSLSAYGLESGSLVLSVGYQDGTELQLTFGAQAPGTTDYYMLRSDNASTVYVMSSTIPDTMGNTVYDMMELPDLPAMDAVSAISLESEGTELLLTSPDGTAWLCGDTDISDSELLADLLNTLSTLKPARCENFKPSADGLALWGMDDPAITVQVQYDGEMLLTLQIGNETLDGTGHYVRINDDTTIYSMGAYTLYPFITAAQQGFVPAADTAAASSAEN